MMILTTLVSTVALTLLSVYAGFLWDSWWDSRKFMFASMLCVLGGFTAACWLELHLGYTTPDTLTIPTSVYSKVIV